MRIVVLAFKEIKFRQLNFLLSVLAVAIAAGVFLITIALLKSASMKTDAIVSAKVQETEREMARLEDEIRKSMKGLGFNIYIFPEGQEMSEVYEKGFASKTMPEEYATKLANSRIVTINHLLPTLTQKIVWPEHKRTIVLIGIRGEVPIAHRSRKKPLIDPVARGDVVLGFELHRSLGFKVGDKVKLLGREFTVSNCHPERGTRDDITVWINLNECQELLDKKGMINAILALECNCETLERLGQVRQEIQAILPATKVIEKGSKALARAEARITARQTAEQQITAMREQRSQLQQRREALAAALVPLIGIICLGGVCLLTFLNVRERVSEVGIFSAVGLRSSTILSLFMTKALFTGVIGGLIGVVLAIAVVAGSRERFFEGYDLTAIVSRIQVVAIVVMMPLFSSVAAWLPSFWAAKRDPAEVLRNE